MDNTITIKELLEKKNINDIEAKVNELKNEVINLQNIIRNINKEVDKTKEVHNLKKRALNENFENFNIDIFSNEIFTNENISLKENVSPRENMTKLISYAENFIMNFDSKDLGNILLYGSSGVGKTYICNCILNSLIKKHYSVRYYTSIELFELISDVFFKKMTHYREEYEYLLECDLLVIEQLGTEIINEFTLGSLLNIIDARNMNYKKTIITTNLRLSELSEKYNEMIFSRFVADYYIFKLFGNDLRWTLE